MIRSDYHLHTSFSADCTVEMKQVVETAINMGIEHLCFTEHHDIDMPGPLIFLLDIPAYQEAFLKYKPEFQKQINLYMGIEIGIQPHLYGQLSQLVHAHPFDFVLCSSHMVDGIDPYFPEFFAGKSKAEAYLGYFNDMLNHVNNYTDYDVYGHLDYLVRYGPYPDKSYLYADYQDVLDVVLKTIIHNGKGIEINASGFRYKLGDAMPSAQVINRYRALGGEIITVGSDAHRPEQLMNDFDLAEVILKKAGFEYYTVFKGRKAEFIKF